MTDRMRNWSLNGEGYLTNSELLAIVIKSGTKNKTCLEIAQDILNDSKKLEMNEFEYLSNLSLQQLQNYEGIGRKKAIQIKAVIELSKRISKSYESDNYLRKVYSPKDIFNLVSPEYCYQKQEILKTIILNKRNVVMSVITNAIGSSDNITLNMKEIFSEPLKQMATSIILIHNHPSGNLKPSKQDILFTNKVKDAGNIFNIELLDHLIIANNNYISLKEKRYFD